MIGKYNLHSLVYKHGAAPRKTAVMCCSHHRQGISLSACLKTWIDFEKTCGTDRFCNIITRKKPFAKADGFFQRCVPLARNVMCPSGVMFALQVMCASRVRKRAHHITLRQRRNTSLWRSHNITAATPQHH